MTILTPIPKAIITPVVEPILGGGGGGGAPTPRLRFDGVSAYAALASPEFLAIGDTAIIHKEFRSDHATFSYICDGNFSNNNNMYCWVNISGANHQLRFNTSAMTVEVDGVPWTSATPLGALVDDGNLHEIKMTSTTATSQIATLGARRNFDSWNKGIISHLETNTVANGQRVWEIDSEDLVSEAPSVGSGANLAFTNVTAPMWVTEPWSLP